MAGTENKNHAGPLHPLDVFYAAGKALPQYVLIDGPLVPEPYRSLLVHTGDMTPALEGFHKKTIHLQVLQSRQEDDDYVREVVLLLDVSNKPVEFGAIKINLALFNAGARADILTGRRPLGSIMRDQKVQHTSRPSAYICVQPDDIVISALQLSKADQSAKLYGRHNTLLTPSGEALADIVEILPP